MINKIKYINLVAVLVCTFFSACAQNTNNKQKSQTTISADTTIDTEDTLVMSDEDWKRKLSPAAYQVLREKATEKPYSGEYEEFWDSGIYVCNACGQELFRSETKFDAHCGWPSFYESMDKSKVKEIVDKSHGMVRTEVVCSRCGGHLGHVFNDGPAENGGMRYCINSLSLGFQKKGTK